MTPDISVSIVNLNGGDLLERAIASVFDHAGDIRIEVILVDNASTDGSATGAVKRWPEIQLIQNTDNLGFGKAHNQAMRVARGRYFLVHNNDAELEPSALGLMLAAIRSRPRIAFVGPRVLNREGNLQVTYGPPPSLREYLPWPRRRLARRILDGATPQIRRAAADEYARRYGYLTTHRVPTICGVCMLVDREAAAELGLFDERFFAYYEDAEWSRRARRAGWEIWYVADAIVRHAWLPLAHKPPSLPWKEVKRFSQGLYYRQEGGRVLYWATALALTCRQNVRRAFRRANVRAAAAELIAFRRGGAAASSAPIIPTVAPAISAEPEAAAGKLRA